MSFFSPLAARMRVRQRRYPVFKVPGRPSSGPALRAGLDRSRLKRGIPFCSYLLALSRTFSYSLKVSGKRFFQTFLSRILWPLSVRLFSTSASGVYYNNTNVSKSQNFVRFICERCF